MTLFTEMLLLPLQPLDGPGSSSIVAQNGDFLVATVCTRPNALYSSATEVPSSLGPV